MGVLRTVAKRAGLGACLLVGLAACSSSVDQSSPTSDLQPLTTVPVSIETSTTTMAPSSAPTTTVELPLRPVAKLRTIDASFTTDTFGPATPISGFTPGHLMAALSIDRFVHLDPTGEMAEGCEASEDPVYRAFLTDVSSANRTTLIDRIGPRDGWPTLGPAGRVALVAGCDANAWLAGVGTLGADGNLQVEGLDQRYHASNNAGFSTTWTADGDVLFFNAWNVEADTGELIEPAPFDTFLQTYARLDDGSRLVGRRDDDDTSFDNDTFFWLLDDSESVDEWPKVPAIFAGQADYPAAKIEIAPDGRQVLVRFIDWNDYTSKTVIVAESEVFEVAGKAWFSPTSDALLVYTPDSANGVWSVLDLASGEAIEVLQPTEATRGVSMQWALDGSGLVISEQLQMYSDEEPATNIWVVAGAGLD